MFSLSSDLAWRATATATVFALALIWLLSGVLAADETEIQPSLAQLNDAAAERANARKPVTVRARRSVASEKARVLALNGKTEVKHVASVQSETTGQVIKRNADDGATVRKGDPICTVEVNDRDARVKAANDAVTLARLEHEGALRLRENDYQRESEVVAAKANLSAMQHALVLAEEALANIVVRAPISGFVERVHATVGDFFVPGSPCATILDLDPIYAVVHIPEQFVDQITLGSEVSATLATGRVVAGEVSFIGKQAADSSRTFRVEVAVPNEGYEIRSGVTAEVGLPLMPHMAHQVSSAILVLGDDGTLGIHTVNNSLVEFHEVEIVTEDSDGLWVSGLSTNVVIITVGQDLVSPGQRVDVQWVSG
ncbi:MAG: efflux RND transporter periplasmic adaptor subunit [Gammaproteobacteria bacterium]|nr:efflux RND transporter periplasmic adaptor subunit [Gammaproteobacteria bacterium]